MHISKYQTKHLKWRHNRIFDLINFNGAKIFTLKTDYLAMRAASPSEHFFNGLGMHKLLLIGWWPEAVKCSQLQHSGWRKTQALAFQAEPRSHSMLRLVLGGQVGGLSPACFTMWATCLSLPARESSYLNKIVHWANFYFNFWVRNSRKIQLCKILFSILCYLSIS